MMMRQVFFVCPHTGIFSVRNYFLLKDQFVIPSAKPHSKGVRSRHADKSIRFFHSVNRFFLFIFWRCLAIIVPSVNIPVFTKMQARPVPINFVRCDAGLRQSQQLSEIPPFDPKSPFLLRLGKAINIFK